MKFSVARSFSLIGLAIGLLLFVTMVNAQQVEKDLTGLTTADAVQLDSTATGKLDGRYVVTFNQAPAAVYEGGVRGFAAASEGPAAVRAFAAHLEDAQQAFLTEISNMRDAKSGSAPTIDLTMALQHGLNAVVVEIDAAALSLIEAHPDVKSVRKVQMYETLTDAGPAWVGAPAVWDGSATGTAAFGEGVIAVVLDSGVNADHPSFAQVDKNGYTFTNPLGADTFLGSCLVGDPNYDADAKCNNKLIGMYDAYAMSSTPEGVGSTDIIDGEDENGHGSHTAGTVAGNFADAEFPLPAVAAGFNASISGVAPHASLITFDVCSSLGNNGPGSSCSGAPILASIDEVARLITEDGLNIRSLNYSISGGGDPYNDDVELGFLNLASLDVYVSASAGNSGPDAETVAHRSPWLQTVAASTHNRSYANSVADMTGGTPPADLAGAGITDGYGPAPIVYAGDFANSNSPGEDPAKCLDPYPAGTFSGQIVVCDRGAIARTAKGQNVLAGGAGGFVLVNVDPGSVVNDPHFLPGVHLNVADGATLKDWIATAANPGDYSATISGFTVDLDTANGDIMAGFSSRGPNTTFDVLKPNITAPGADILAAVADQGNDVADVHEFDYLSGTSMSSPHSAGTAVLMAQLHPTWTAQQIKSALMMTAVNDGVLKEDGATAADPFDIGAGSVRVNVAAAAGLVMDETRANYEAAETGDVKTLNIPSMMDSNCYIQCDFVRTVMNPTDETVTWNASVAASNGLEANVSPKTFTLAPGESQELGVSILTTGAMGDGYLFAQLDLVPDAAPERAVPSAHMPIAVVSVKSQDASSITKVADVAMAAIDDTVGYTITVVNNALVTRTFDILDTLPDELTYVDGSLAGGTYDAGSKSISATATLGPSGESLDAVATMGNPLGGYFSLGGAGVTAATLPANADDGCLLFDLPLSLEYLGQSFTQVIVNMNGTISFGLAEGECTTAGNEAFPTSNQPANLVAPWWDDLNATNGGTLYVATFAGGTGFAVEWNAFPYFDAPASTATFQVWIDLAGDEILFAYPANFTDLTDSATIGAQNGDKTLGTTYLFNGAGGAVPDGSFDVEIQNQTFSADPAVITFSAMINDAGDGIVVNKATVAQAAQPVRGNGDNAAEAYAAVRVGEFTSVAMQQSTADSNQLVLVAVAAVVMLSVTGLHIAQRKED